MANASGHLQSYLHVIENTWRDPQFKARLKSDPHAVLKEVSVIITEDVTIKVEDTSDITHLVIPNSPADNVLKQADVIPVTAKCKTDVIACSRQICKQSLE